MNGNTIIRGVVDECWNIKQKTWQRAAAPFSVWGSRMIKLKSNVTRFVMWSVLFQPSDRAQSRCILAGTKSRSCMCFNEWFSISGMRYTISDLFFLIPPPLRCSPATAVQKDRTMSRRGKPQKTRRFAEKELQLPLLPFPKTGYLKTSTIFRHQHLELFIW